MVESTADGVSFSSAAIDLGRRVQEPALAFATELTACGIEALLLEWDIEVVLVDVEVDG